MGQFDTLQSITSRLKELGDQLSTSRLSQEKLEEFETLSRKLYEITVILNYKAKEEVFKNSSAQKEKPQDTKKKTSEKTQERKSSVPKKREEKTVPTPGSIEFDFSGDPMTSEDAEVNPTRATQNEEVSNTESQPNEKEVQPPESNTERNIETDNKPKTEIKVFYQHFSLVYNETSKDKISNSKIASIRDAIGLNEKLQFIGELFGGNSELFNQTIESLDQQENNEVAIKKLSEVAAQNKWDKETELVDQFANIVNRRYVE